MNHTHVVVLSGQRRLSSEELADRSIYMLESAAKTRDPGLRQARIDAASALSLEAQLLLAPAVRGAS